MDTPVIQSVTAENLDSGDSCIVAERPFHREIVKTIVSGIAFWRVSRVGKLCWIAYRSNQEAT
jgi:hypothetical protein